jgi:hypothetical protein
MSRIDHNRPQLRVLDNLRRELQKAQPETDSLSVDYSWPEYLRPLAQKEKSFAALFDLLETLSVWIDEAEALSFSQPTPQVQRACRAFAVAPVYHQYDNRFSGRDWLGSLQDHPSPDARAIGGFLSLIMDNADPVVGH